MRSSSLFLAFGRKCSGSETGVWDLSSAKCSASSSRQASWAQDRVPQFWDPISSYIHQNKTGMVFFSQVVFFTVYLRGCFSYSQNVLFLLVGCPDSAFFTGGIPTVLFFTRTAGLFYPRSGSPSPRSLEGATSTLLSRWLSSKWLSFFEAGPSAPGGKTILP